MLAQIDVIQLFEKVSLPAGLIIVFGLALRAFFNWAGPRIDKMLDKQQQTMEKVAESSAKSAEAVARLVPLGETIDKVMNKLADDHEHTAKKVDEIHENTAKKIDEIHEAMQQVKKTLRDSTVVEKDKK